MLLICLAIIRIYICDKVKLDYFLAGLYPVNIITFIITSLAIALNSKSKNMSFLINSIMIIGIIIFILASISSLKNIKNQNIKINKPILCLTSIICVITIIPAFLISIIMLLIDLGMFIKHISSLDSYRKFVK
ncbi:heme/copper-type cytochrome/quinol oxidase subunit 2 [Clostridium sardiniense]|nr:heme/copper-type cytochrome/quinol oxidase subunit 2 [Clostridium sardiniense]